MSKLRTITLQVILLIVVGAVAIIGTHAQELCEVIAREAFEAVGENCGEVGTESACYGYDSLSATFKTEAIDPKAFVNPSDLVEVMEINTVKTSPYDEAEEEWGIGYFQIPVENTDPVVMMVAGDVIVENAAPTDSADTQPMQDFNFTTAGRSDCKETPNAVYIQGPKDIKVDMKINGTQIQLGTTVVLGTEESENGDELMWFGVLEGELVIKPGTPDEVRVPAGTYTTVKLSDEFGRGGSAQVVGLRQLVVRDPVTGAIILGPDGEPFYRRVPVEAFAQPQAITEAGDFYTGYESYGFVNEIPEKLVNYPVNVPVPSDATATPTFRPRTATPLPTSTSTDVPTNVPPAPTTVPTATTVPPTPVLPFDAVNTVCTDMGNGTYDATFTLTDVPAGTTQFSVFKGNGIFLVNLPYTGQSSFTQNFATADLPITGVVAYDAASQVLANDTNPGNTAPCTAGAFATSTPTDLPTDTPVPPTPTPTDTPIPALTANLTSCTAITGTDSDYTLFLNNVPAGTVTIDVLTGSGSTLPVSWGGGTSGSLPMGTNTNTHHPLNQVQAKDGGGTVLASSGVTYDVPCPPPATPTPTETPAPAFDVNITACTDNGDGTFTITFSVSGEPVGTTNIDYSGPNGGVAMPYTFGAGVHSFNLPSSASFPYNTAKARDDALTDLATDGSLGTIAPCTS